MARLVVVSNRVPIPKSRGATAGGLANDRVVYLETLKALRTRISLATQ